MEQMASHLDEAYDGAQAWMKVHIPAGLVAEGYADPVTGEDINFNFLTYYADDRLAVMPHTVQHYALDDPAPTYGNLDFSHMWTYLRAKLTPSSHLAPGDCLLGELRYRRTTFSYLPTPSVAFMTSDLGRR